MKAKPSNVLAQVTPDATLGSESSTVNSVNELRDRIEGGAVRGENLFHSFKEFNVSEGLEVYFGNPEAVSNIFSRVTGNEISEIFGTLGVEGTANLFLINPNGIIFGENAVVDVGGSFIATTAESIEFNDGSTWNIRDRNSKPLLTWNAPIGLGLEETSGSIIVQNYGHTLEDDFGGSFTQVIPNQGLKILPGFTIALFGKTVNLEGGIVTSFSGKIEIAAVEEGTITFNLLESDGNWNFNYEKVAIFGDINFTTRSLIDVSSVSNNPVLSGGTIKISGRNVLLKDGSVILNKNFGTNNSGSIQVDATESIRISGTDPIAGVQGGIRTENIEKGNGGNIVISTPNFVAFDGASVATISYSQFPENSSGNIFLNTSKTQISGSSPISAFSVSNVATFTFGSGKAGDVTINSGILTIKDGGGLGSSGFFGSVGKISVTATDYIEIEGFQPLVFIGSGIASINAFSTNSGNINVTTPNLYIRNGGGITTSTFGQGNAGDIFIDAKNISIAGKIPNSEEFDFETSSNISSSTSTVNNILFSQLPLLEVIDEISLEGDAGNIIISTDSLAISGSASINVQNVGTGNAGTIQINTNFLNIETKGEIAATSLSGEGGNINLKSDRIVLENSSLDAFAEGEGDGGNITIDTNVLIGIDSDINATAISGDGGNITIEAAGLLGLETQTLRIDASSEFGQDGTITIVNPQINNRDPVFELVALETTNEENNLDSRCEKNSFNKTLIYTGRARLNPSTRSLSSEEIYLPAPGFVPPGESNPKIEDSPWQEGDPIIDSNAVRIDEQGNIAFVAELSPKTARELLCNTDAINSQSD